MIIKHQKCDTPVSVVYLEKYLKKTQEFFLRMNILQYMKIYINMIKFMVFYQIIYIVMYITP